MHIVLMLTYAGTLACACARVHAGTRMMRGCIHAAHAAHARARMNERMMHGVVRTHTTHSPYAACSHARFH
eukprot:4059942-Pleurochrysis_carterae.AAC.1